MNGPCRTGKRGDQNPAGRRLSTAGQNRRSGNACTRRKNGPQRDRTKEWTDRDLRNSRLGYEEMAYPSHPSCAGDPNARRESRTRPAEHPRHSSARPYLARYFWASEDVDRCFGGRAVRRPIGLTQVLLNVGVHRERDLSRTLRVLCTQQRCSGVSTKPPRRLSGTRVRHR